MKGRAAKDPNTKLSKANRYLIEGAFLVAIKSAIRVESTPISMNITLAMELVLNEAWKPISEPNLP